MKKSKLIIRPSANETGITKRFSQSRILFLVTAFTALLPQRLPAPSERLTYFFERDINTVMVKDINSSLVPVGNLIVMNGAIFFVGFDEDHGRELWTSDGTEAGTRRIKDIGPGSDGSDPENLFNFNGTLFFSADDRTSGRELWTSDGTEAGTKRVKDIRPGPESSYPSLMVSMNGALFFVADDGATGGELWKSDGREAGTVRVKDIWPGPSESGVNNFMNVDGTLFFTANDGTSGAELWRSDGTEAGTARVADIRPGSYGSCPGEFVKVNGTVFFTADDGTTGRGLWRIGGTQAGIRRLTTGVPFWNWLNDAGNVNGILFLGALMGPVAGNCGQATARKLVPSRSRTFNLDPTVRMPRLSSTSTKRSF